MVDLSNLNNEQKEAVVTTEGYVRVIASPGSGKTRALTHRFAYLVETLNIPSNNILCITYTNKAATEMKDRIINLLNHNSESLENISTIHSYCDRFLRKYMDKLNYLISSNYTIYDEYDSSKIVDNIKENYKNIKDEKTTELIKIISDYKKNNASYIEYLFGVKDEFSFDEEWIKDVIDICRNNNGLMFDDLIYSTMYILKNQSSIRKDEQKQYKYILVDEFQDTTPDTYELVKILSEKHKNLFVVGDPDQSIYEFIGANPAILLDKFIEDFPDAKTLLMNTNYRSTNQIIELSNQLISNNDNRFKQKNTVSYDPNNADGSKVVYSHFVDKDNQYYNVCRIIKHLCTNLKYDYNDIMLIARNNYCFNDLKKELIQNDIPYVNSKNTANLNSKEEIKLITYYLSFALSQNAFALYQINNIKNLDIDEKEMKKVLNVNVKPYEFLEEHMNSKISKFIGSNESIRKAIFVDKRKTSEIIEMIVGEHEILASYKPDPDTEYFAQAERIGKVIQSIICNEKMNSNYSVYDFLDSIALDSTIESNKNETGVKLMTAHGAKGLETKNVIVFDYQIIPYKTHEIEAERRLSYVAFTRAKENLFILSCANKKSSLESRYAKEFRNLCISVDKYFENNEVEYSKYNYETCLEDLNEEKQQAFKVFCSGKNVFLTGEAGTGKTYLINKYLEYLHGENKSVLVCAPTGIAASNYTGGTTIHRAFNIPIVPSVIPLVYPTSTIISNYDVIIIDEISMCRIDMFDYIMRCVDASNKCRHIPIQVVLCGDFFQLPPVILEKEKMILKKIFPNFQEGFAFESNAWDKHNFVKICLKEVFRQNHDEFLIALNNARRGINLDESIEFINNNCAKERIEGAMEIHSRNSDVSNINNSSLAKLPTKEYVYYAKKSGIISGDFTVEEELHLKPGCRVMLLINHTRFQYQNGSFATVLTCEDGYVDVILDKDKSIVRVPGFKFSCVSDPELLDDGSIAQNATGEIVQIPMKLAYAITIHKSQGQTYDKVNLDPEGWESGQVYVALSRIKSIQGLFLYKNIKRDALKVSEQVKKFYDEM